MQYLAPNVVDGLLHLPHFVAACEPPFLGPCSCLLLQRLCSCLELICSSPCNGAVVHPLVAYLVSVPLSVLRSVSHEDECVELISVFSFISVHPGNLNVGFSLVRG